MPVYKLLTNRTTIVTGDPVVTEQVQDSLSVQHILTGSGALTATVVTQGSADGVNFITLATTKMSGTTLVTEGFTIKDPWEYISCSITAISGTSATLTSLMVA